LFVDGFTGDVEDTAKGAGTDWNGNSCPSVLHGLPTAKAVGGAHGDRANAVVAKVLLDFKDQPRAIRQVGLDRVVDFRQLF
jgi:hypothetical protein